MEELSRNDRKLCFLLTSFCLSPEIQEIGGGPLFAASHNIYPLLLNSFFSFFYINNSWKDAVVKLNIIKPCIRPYSGAFFSFFINNSWNYFVTLLNNHSC